MARPKPTDPRLHYLHVKLTTGELEMLRRQAAVYGRDVSAHVRELLRQVDRELGIVPGKMMGT